MISSELLRYMMDVCIEVIMSGADEPSSPSSSWHDIGDMDDDDLIPGGQSRIVEVIDEDEEHAHRRRRRRHRRRQGQRGRGRAGRLQRGRPPAVRERAGHGEREEEGTDRDTSERVCAADAPQRG